jgi:CBS domain containing-hemolysin-like protein
MVLLFVYLILAIGVSFLCSILEAVLLSVTPAYVANLEDSNPRVGSRLRNLKQDIDRPLSAILSLNTVAHTIGAAGVGVQAQIVFGEAFVTITSVVLTILILVFSEIIPKTLGATYWRALAPWATGILRVLVPILYPLVLLAQGITKILSGKRETHLFHRHELGALAEIGVREGVIREQYSRIVKNLIRLDSLRGRDIMTPRTVVIMFPETATIEELLADKASSAVARVPVYAGSLDEITGYVLRDDILERYAAGEKQLPIKKIKREALVLPDLVRIGDLFEKLLNRQEQIALLINEYGEFSGVATIEDIVETIVGMDIVDEDDTVTNRRRLAHRLREERGNRLGISQEPAKPSSAEDGQGKDSKDE